MKYTYISFIIILFLFIGCNSATNNDSKVNKINDTIKIANGEQIVKKYYDNGNLKSIERFKDKKKVGVNLLFYDNEILDALFTYKDNRKNGEFLFYFPDGKIYKKGIFKNDDIDGLFVEYTEEGDTLAKAIYEKGETVLSLRYKNGKPSTSMDFKNNRFTAWDSLGNVTVSKKALDK